MNSGTFINKSCSDSSILQRRLTTQWRLVYQYSARSTRRKRSFSTTKEHSTTAARSHHHHSVPANYQLRHIQQHRHDHLIGFDGPSVFANSGTLNNSGTIALDNSCAFSISNSARSTTTALNNNFFGTGGALHQLRHDQQSRRHIFQRLERWTTPAQSTIRRPHQ